MLPPIVASEVQRALLDYLRTTFRLRNKGLEEALFRFLSDEATGMFRGPYLDIKLPFRRAPEGWQANSPLDLEPPFTPHAHQLRAFERLSSRDRHPLNTLVTTGTGSGKTECFLYPVLDHCRRARQRGERGIKAILLYPMNALASDQAERIAGLLQSPELENVTAGLYVGGSGTHSASGPTHLVDQRSVLRDSPPDLLLTNYRMLDFLLMRPEDSLLWEINGPTTLQYLVLDELHTYDGAQGSDVACLIRRLKARLNVPHGHLCCVGTSATIGTGGAHDPERLLAEFASKIFAEPFSTESLIGEDRLSTEEAFISRHDNHATPYDTESSSLAELDPGRYPSIEAYVAAQEKLWFKHKPFGRTTLSEELGGHPFLAKLFRGLVGKERRSGPRHWREVADWLATEDADFEELDQEQRRRVLASFVSLIAWARTQSEPPSPFLHVQVQLWVRELHGLLRLLTPVGYRFAWQDELKAADGEHWLPMVFCRECGFDGFAAIQREGEALLHDTLGEIGEAFLHRGNRGRVIELNDGDTPNVSSLGQAELQQQRLCPKCLRLGTQPECQWCAERGSTLSVRMHPELNEHGKPQPLDRCPSCQADTGVGFLASRAATLSSVAVSELFVGRYNDDPKLLAFTDSVQDASHRAGFFAARTFRFTMRTAIQTIVEAAREPIPLSQFTDRLLDYWVGAKGEAEAAALLLPPDLNEDGAYLAYFGLDEHGVQKKGHVPTARQRRELRALLQERIGWEVTREYGLAVPFGRSLDATGCSTLAFSEERLDAACQELIEHLREHHRASFRQEPELSRVRHFVEGMLQRLRLKGGIFHPLLDRFAKQGQRRLLYKRMNPRLSRFGPNSDIPLFWYQGESEPKLSYQALHSPARMRTWYRVWAARALGLRQENDIGMDALFDRTVRALRDHGVVQSVKGVKDRAVFGIDPAAALISAEVRRVRCTACGHKLTLGSAAAERFAGRSCLRFACATGTYILDDATEASQRYYQDLYRSGRVERIFTGEHTGLLERSVREARERSFKVRDRPDAPNLLACTPTLEMGIDIGDLSAVMLCSVPPLPAKYVQRVGRAGRKTGNAAVLTVASRHPHDRYFYEEPYEMLRGEIAPPGCFLDAPEMLTRQLLAHAMDCWARERERTRGAIIPAQMGFLRVKAEDAFPGQFWKYYQQHKGRLTDEFLALFAPEVGPENCERIRGLASGEGLAGPMRAAFVAVKDEIKAYREQVKKLQERIRELENDPRTATLWIDDETGEERVDRDVELSELKDAEQAYTRLRVQLSHKYPLNVLADAGLIPNYAFPEPGVTLSALLRGPVDPDEGKTPGQKVEYMRAASQAIREFAPFNTFYAEGHKIRVSQVDLGKRAAALEDWRLCARCHHMEHVVPDAAVGDRCPTCGDARWPDVGQRRTLVRFRRALSLMNRIEASTAEDAEDRERESYRLISLIDVAPENWCGALLVQRAEMVFGVELLKNQSLRELNLGRQADVAKAAALAGQEVAQRGFLICRHCGQVSQSEALASHAPTCLVRRRNTKPQFERILLYREFRSEAIRLLLPVSQLEDTKLLHSLKAALFLGFRRKFLGQPDHLNITIANEPRGNDLRRFLVIYDTVPGGTGYLAELWKSGGVLEVMRLAVEAMQSCRCTQDETKDGCYRCVYAYQQSHEIPLISRSRAVAALEAILALAGELESVRTLSDADIGDLTESELERKFLAALEERAQPPDCSWEAVQHGGKPCHVLRTPNSEWLIEPQVDLGPESGVTAPSRPDFVLRCLSSTSELPIAVFCDGLRYHVAPHKETSRLGDDIDKRNSILASGNFRVWSITWKDLDEGAKGLTTVLTRVQRALYQKYFQSDWDLRWKRDDALRSRSSWQLLWEYLEHPDAETWTQTAVDFAASMIHFDPPWSTESIQTLQTALLNEKQRLPGVLRVADLKQGAPLRWAGFDERQHVALLAQIPSTALQQKKLDQVDLTLRLFDDHKSRQHDDFEDDWRAFLHAWNLLQFHPLGVAAVSGESLIHAGVLDADDVPRAAPARRVTSEPPSAPKDAYERFSRDYAAEPNIVALAALLRERALPIPGDPVDLGLPDDLDALLAWPNEKVVLVPEPTDNDLAAWKSRGWRALDCETPATEILQVLVARP